MDTLRESVPAGEPASPCAAALAEPEQTQRLLALYQKALGHDLPNHLVAIQGLARMLELDDGGRLSDRGREYLHRLRAAAQRTGERIKVLADMGRQLRDPQPLVAVPLAEALREAVVEIKLLFPGRFIEYHFQEPLPTLDVTRSGLRQVLVQLLRNAVQSVGAEGTPCVELGCQEAARTVEFWIADNGRGFSPDQLPLVQAFLAGSGASTSLPGLGLALVREIVARWDGAVQVHARPGTGSRVTILVPRRPSGPAEA